MEQEHAGPALGWRDFDEFGRWYSYRRQHATGRPASRHTLRTKQVHIASAANAAGCPDAVSLGTLLGDRHRTVFLLEKTASRMTPGAMRQHVYALRDFGEFAVSRGWIGGHTVSRDDIPGKNPPAPIVVYGPDEMEEFVSAARGTDLRFWALLAFLVDTGRRIGDALSLEWSFFRLDATPAYIELPQTKNGEPQYVPLPRRQREQVWTPANIERLRSEVRVGRRQFHRDHRQFVFPWTYGTAKSRFDRLCAVTGLPNRGFHNFRHTVITDRLAQGMPLQAVSALAGHANPGITGARYNHTNALTYAGYLD